MAPNTPPKPPPQGTYNTFPPTAMPIPPLPIPRRRMALSLSRMLTLKRVLFMSFWMFGVLGTMQFGVVLTAANDLVGNKAPPGIILLAYTLPSVLVRTFVPYLTLPSISLPFLPAAKTHPYSGGINYAARLTLCAVSSFVGLQLLAWSTCVPVRMVGIAAASLSSNLGDMTFYQLTTRYSAHLSSTLSGYAGGSGAAGLVGAGIYTLLTTSFLRVRPEVVLSGVGVAPCVVLAVFLVVLPPRDRAGTGEPEVEVEDEVEVGGKYNRRAGRSGGGCIMSKLSIRNKISLVLPLLGPYLAPLAGQMFLENLSTQGTLPTLLYHPPLPPLFYTARDFYPVFFTTYHTFLFLGRLSIVSPRLRLPQRRAPAWAWALFAVSMAMALLLATLSMSMRDPLAERGVLMPPLGVAAVVAVLGAAGGVGMSNTYWRVAREKLPRGVWRVVAGAVSQRGVRGQRRGRDGDGEGERQRFLEEEEEEEEEDGLGIDIDVDGVSMETQAEVREFLVGAVALPDTLAIMVAGAVSMGVQVALCGAQVRAGRGLCVEG